MAQIVIPARFNGPPNTGNGGYVAGKVSAAMREVGISGSLEVVLRAPPPLDAVIDIVAHGDGFECRHGEAVIATVRESAALEVVPEAPSLALASQGRAHFPPLADHAYPHCFVCGPSRPDGLCIFTGRPHGFDGVVDVWTPATEFADSDGHVREEILWAALDCPGAFAVGFRERPMVLGSIAGDVYRRPEAGAPLIVAAWHLFDNGRKHGATSALFTAEGELLAQTEQLWIELK